MSELMQELFEEKFTKALEERGCDPNHAKNMSQHSHSVGVDLMPGTGKGPVRG